MNTQRVLLVPRHEGRYASVGVIAAVESVGDLPMGGRAAILRGVQRGRVGAAVASEQGGLWVTRRAGRRGCQRHADRGAGP